MKRLLLGLLCVLFLSGNAIQRDMIYVQEFKEKGLMRIVNTHSHAIFCARVEKGKLVEFYVYKQSTSAPFPTTKVWCSVPGKKV